MSWPTGRPKARPSVPAHRSVAPSARAPPELEPGGRARQAATLGEPGPPARQALQSEEAGGQDEEERRQLGGRRSVEHPVPHAIDRLRQGAKAKGGDGAEVGEGLHARQRRARGEGGARQRQGHAKQDRPPGPAQAARAFQELRRLLGERRPRERVHVGVVDERHHERDTPASPEIGEARAGAEPVAKRRLDRPRVLEEAEEDEADHVGRKRQGQDQRPLEDPPTRKLARHDEPREGRAEEEDSQAHRGDEPDRVEDQLRELRPPQMRPDGPGRPGEGPKDGKDRKADEAGGGERRRGPGPRRPGPRDGRPEGPGRSGHAGG